MDYLPGQAEQVPDLDLARYEGAAAAGRIDTLVDVYVDAYSDPPYYGISSYGPDAFLERTRRQVGRDGFSLVTALDQSTLAGFSFGFTFEADRWWGGAVDPEPPVELLDVPKFAVIELVVERGCRGRGLATRLMNAVLAQRPEPYATLLVHPEAAARQIYLHWGWQYVGAIGPVPGAPRLDVMLLELESAPAWR